MLLRTNGETASRLFGLPLGTLQPGAGADLILVDYQPYTPLTGENYKGHILFGLSGAMTDTTIINGKLLMRHRKFTLPGVETLLEASRKEAAALWRSMYE